MNKMHTNDLIFIRNEFTYRNYKNNGNNSYRTGVSDDFVLIQWDYYWHQTDWQTASISIDRERRQWTFWVEDKNINPDKIRIIPHVTTSNYVGDKIWIFEQFLLPSTMLIIMFCKTILLINDHCLWVKWEPSTFLPFVLGSSAHLWLAEGGW